jgi:hypothetical protein
MDGCFGNQVKMSGKNYATIHQPLFHFVFKYSKEQEEIASFCFKDTAETLRQIVKIVPCTFHNSHAAASIESFD